MPVKHRKVFEVWEGGILKASQPTKDSAMKFMKPGRKLKENVVPEFIFRY